MAFTVQIADAVVLYIQGCERLTISDQERIFQGMDEELSKSADRFLEQNPNPLQPNLFWYDYVLATEAREVREFHFWCNAEEHVYGVTEVLYAEEYPVDD